MKKIPGSDQYIRIICIKGDKQYVDDDENMEGVAADVDISAVDEYIGLQILISSPNIFNA